MLIKERGCTKCEEIKPFSEFHKSAKGKYGISCVCKPCSSAISKQKYIDDPERMRSYSKYTGYSHEHYLKNKDKIRAAHKKYYENNKEEILQKYREKYQSKKNNNGLI